MWVDAKPVVVMLAAGVLGCSGPGEPPTTQTAADSADQVLWPMRLTVTTDGVLRAVVEADTALIYQTSQTAQLYGITVEFHSATGELTSTVTAERGTYDLRTDDMEARGDVVAVTPDGRRLTTSVLRYDRSAGTISGPEPFVFDAPDRHLEGDAFTADPDFRNVSAVRPRRGRSGDADVPGRQP